MTLVMLRIVLFIETVICAIAIFVGNQLINWRQMPTVEFNSSPDAFYYMEEAGKDWKFLSGGCLGMLLCLMLIAIAQRKQIKEGNLILKAHWIAAALPSAAILWETIRLT